MRIPWGWPLLVAALGLVLAGCDRAEPTPSASPSSPPPSASAPPTASPSSAGAPTAIEAYRGMWAAYIQAIRVPDPDFPDLARYTQGSALAAWVRGLTSAQQQGLVGQGDVILNPSVTAVNPNLTPPTVEIKDCVDTSQTRLVKKDGSPHQDTPGGKRSAKATVARIDERTWKVTEFAVFGVGTCT